MSEQTVKELLGRAKRLVPSMASPGYWREAGEYRDPLERLAITRAEAALITEAAAEADQELRQRELHHFETEQENAELAKDLDWAKKSRLRWKDRCVEAQRERDALRDGRTPDQHLRDRVRQLEAELAKARTEVAGLEAKVDEEVDHCIQGSVWEDRARRAEAALAEAKEEVRCLRAGGEY